MLRQHNSHLVQYKLTNKGESMSESTKALKRIADAIEEILRLVKKDQEDSAARQRQREAE